MNLKYIKIYDLKYNIKYMNITGLCNSGRLYHT